MATKRRKPAETSDRVSSIAGRREKISGGDIVRLVLERLTYFWGCPKAESPNVVDDLASDIRTLAGSCLRQDETKGKRKK